MTQKREGRNEETVCLNLQEGRKYVHVGPDKITESPFKVIGGVLISLFWPNQSAENLVA